MDEKDITCEEWREYDIPGRPAPYRIAEPQKLITRVGGTTHRIVDVLGVVHCLPSPGQGGCVLRWKSRDAAKPVNY
jgi:hypothetical protein